MQPATLIQLLLCFLVVPATDAQRGKGPQREEPLVPPVARGLQIEVNGEGQCRHPQPNCTDLAGGECVSVSQVCPLCEPPGHLLDDLSCDGGRRFFCCVTNNECIDAGGFCQFRLPWLEGGSDGRESDGRASDDEPTPADSKRFTTALKCGSNTQLQCYIDSSKADCAEKAGFCTGSEECRDGEESLGPDSCGSGQRCCVPNTVRGCKDAEGICKPLDQECCGKVSEQASHKCGESTECCIPHPIAVCSEYGGVCMDDSCDDGYVEFFGSGSCDFCCLSKSDDPRCSVFPNVNFTGDTLAIIDSVKSPAWCRNLCDVSPRCHFYTWIGPSFSEPSRHFNCLLQRSSNAYPTLITSPAEGMTSGLDRCDHDCFRTGSLQFIGEILNITSADILTCETMCDNNSNCDFWSWNGDDQMCYIQKSSLTGNGHKLPSEVKDDGVYTSGFSNCDKSPWFGPNADNCTCW